MLVQYFASESHQRVRWLVNDESVCIFLCTIVHIDFISIYCCLLNCTAADYYQVFQKFNLHILLTVISFILHFRFNRKQWCSFLLFFVFSLPNFVATQIVYIFYYYIFDIDFFVVEKSNASSRLLDGKVFYLTYKIQRVFACCCFMPR